jgi:hypothetical protein
MRNLFAASLTALCLACSAGAEVLPAEKALPDDTLLMFTLPDFSKVRDIYQHSPHGRFWNDPAMKDFKDKFLGKLTGDYLTPLEHQLGVRFADYTNLAQGQFTIALVQNGWLGVEGQSPAFVVLLDAKDQSAQLKTNLAELKKKWVDSGKTVQTETIHGIDFSAITPALGEVSKTLKKPLATLANGQTVDPMDDPDAKKAPKSRLYIGQVESLLVVGDTPKVIEKILARMSGGPVKTLSEVAGFDANAGMFHDVPAFGWINAKALVEVWSRPKDEPADAETANPLGFKPDKVMAALGLNGLKSIAFNYSVSSEGTLCNIMLAVPESSRTGLFKILAGESKDYNPPPFVPADAVKFQRWRIDGQKTWATIRKMLSDISPPALGMMDFVLKTADAAAKEKDPGFDLDKALFGNLGDDIITYEKSPSGGSLAELSSPPSIFLISSPNPEQIAGALKSLLVLYTQPSTAPADREFLGHKIYTIPLPAAPTAGGKGPAAAPRSLSYACASGYVAITTDTAILEEFLRSGETPPKPLSETPGLSDAAQKVTGSGASLFGFANEKQSRRVLFETLKKDPDSLNNLEGLAPLASLMGLPELKVKDWVDVSLLPDFGQVSRYFYFSVYGGSANADGLTFKAFAPTPPELNK